MCLIGCWTYIEKASGDFSRAYLSEGSPVKHVGTSWGSQLGSEELGVHLFAVLGPASFPPGPQGREELEKMSCLIPWATTRGQDLARDLDGQRG